MFTLPYRRAEETGYWCKWERKEIEGAAMQFAIYLNETAILGLAKVIEDIKVLLKQKLGHRFHPWNEHIKLPYLDENIRTVWALSNIIKHNRSLLTRGSSNYVDFILDKWEIVDGYDLESIILSRHDCFCIGEHIVKLYLSLSKLIEEVSGARPHFDGEKWEDIANDLFSYLVPDNIGLEVPTFDSLTLDASKV
tara:strand:- start:214 stop:795 length:582 start_codon:yes stop_codon:yes gene_type:complete